MALERERKNVAIGNMPIVQPQSAGALAKFAENVQDDLVKQRLKEKDDNDRMAVAQKKAMIFDTLTQIQLAQEAPNSSQFGIDAGKQLKKIIGSAENDEQRTALTIASSQIASSFTNSIAQKEAIYNSDIAIGEVEGFAKDTVDIHSALPADEIGKNNNIEMSDALIDQYAADKVAKSLGRITPAKAKLWARELKGQIREKVAFSNYMGNLKTYGRAVADAGLSKEAQEWAKTADEEMSFRKDVRDQLSTMEIKQEIKKIFADKMEAFEKASFANKQAMLPELEATLPVELYSKAANVVMAGKELIVSTGAEAGIKERLVGITTETELVEAEKLLKPVMQTAKEHAMLTDLISKHRVDMMEAKIKDQVDAQEEQQKAVQEREVQSKLNAIANGEEVDSLYYSDGSPITQPGHISRIEGAKRTARNAHMAYKNWVGNGRTGTPSTEIMTGINNEFNKKLGSVWQNFMVSGDAESAMAINDFVVENKTLPTTISDSLKYKNFINKPVEEISNLASLVATIDTNENKNAGVVQALGNLDPETRIFLERFSLVPEEKRASYMNEYQRLLTDAKNNPDKMPQNKVAAEITAPTVEGEVGLMEQGFVDYVADSTITDVFKSFTNHFVLNIPFPRSAKDLGVRAVETKMAYMDTYMRRTHPSLFLKQTRGTKHGLGVAVFGVDEGDVEIHMGREAKKYLANQAATTYVESGGIGTPREMAKIAWEKTSTKIGYSVLQKPTFQGKGVDDNDVVQAFIPELTSGLSVPDTAIVMIESAAQAWKMSSKEMKGRFEFKGEEYKRNGKLDMGALFDAGRIAATAPLPQKDGTVLHKLMVKDDSGQWKTIPNFSSDKVAASDYFNLGNAKILENRTWNTRKFDGSGD